MTASTYTPQPHRHVYPTHSAWNAAVEFNAHCTPAWFPRGTLRISSMGQARRWANRAFCVGCKVRFYEHVTGREIGVVTVGGREW